MPRKIEFQGTVHEFPDKATDDQIRTALAATGTKPPAAQPTPPSALSRLGSAFWEGIGGKAVTDMMGGASRHPEHAKKARETARGLVEGLANEPGRVWDELGKTGEAMVKGDIPGTAEHLAGSVPIVGAPALQVEHDFQNGDYASGFGHALALLLPFAAKNVKGADLKNAALATKNAAQAVGAGVSAAAPDVAAGTLKAAAGAAASSIVPGHGKYIAGIELTRPGLKQIVKGAKAGVEAGRESLRPKAGPGAPRSLADIPVSELSEAEQALVHDILAGTNSLPVESPAAAAPPIPPESPIIPPQTPPEAPIPTPQPSQAQPQPVPLRNTPGLSSASPTSLAEQLKAMALESGTVTPEQVLPGGPVATRVPPGNPQPALAKQMRPLSPAQRKAVADANYRGGGENVAETYEAGGRATKTEKLRDALVNRKEGPITADQAKAVEGDAIFWEQAAKAAGVPNPGKATISQVIFELRKLEQKAKKPATPPTKKGAP